MEQATNFITHATFMAQAGMIQSIFQRRQRRFAGRSATQFVGLVACCLLAAQAQAQAFVSPLSLIPDTAAGIVCVPDMPQFCGAWKTTNLSAFAHDDAMKPFVDAQQARAQQELLAADLKVGIKIRDLLEIASGESVIAWLPFKDARRPYSLVVIADIRQLKAKADQAIAQVDTDLKAAGATRNDVKYGNDTIRVYALKAKPGQLKIEQVAIMLNGDLIIASDRDSVVTATMDAIAGKANGPRLIDSAEYKRIQTQVKDRPALNVAAGQAGVVGLQWFARPLAMAKIAKDAIGIDRGKQVNLVNLLERQGFDAIRAAGGQFTIGHRDFDLLHYGFVLAPPVTNVPSKYKLAARMLDFPNSKTEPIPAWVSDKIATYNRINWNMKDAFWAAETLVNDAFSDEIFRDIFDGIRDDEDGPKIDVEKNVIPNLGTHLIMLTDNELPASEKSERMLIAIEVTNAAALRDAVKRAMEVEPDATLIEGVPGADVYRVLRTDTPSGFDAELFDDLGLGKGAEADAPAPLLNQWAITVIGTKGKPDGYLVFSSHPQMLIETANRMLVVPEGAGNGFGDTPESKKVTQHLIEIGGKEFAIQRIVRTDLSMRVKYSLLREGKLRDSDTLLASLIRRGFEKIKETDDDPLSAKKLPPIEQVEKYFRPAGTYLRTIPDGWLLDGFLMK